MEQELDKAMNNIFDSHSHYDDDRFKDDLDDLLTSFPSMGVSGIISCSVNIPTSKFNIELAEKYDFCYASVGFHPLNLEDVSNDYISDLKILSSHKKVVAIGEIGLDYYYEKETRTQQLELCENQIILANELDLPIIFHDRDAHEDTMNLLKKHKPKGVVHCFSGSVEMAKEVLKLGMYIGIGGAVTFKNAVKPIEVAKFVPHDRLLIETDAPYMTPVPFRGKRCTSLHIPYTAEKLAEIRNCTAQDILDLTAKNAKALFKI
ncbi:MAG: TatD family hydrolase [Oscillospiraceae bacterium]